MEVINFDIYKMVVEKMYKVCKSSTQEYIIVELEEYDALMPIPENARPYLRRFSRPAEKSFFVKRSKYTWENCEIINY